MKKILTALCALAIAAMPAFAQNFKELEKKAKSGDAAAMVELGNCFFNGTEGASKDAKKAKDWYEKAAKAGNLDAYEGLVACYDSWDGIEKNPEKADAWLKAGADAGNVKLMLRLANERAANGDYYFAAKYYNKAALAGAPEAMVPAVQYAYASFNVYDLLLLSFKLANKPDLTPDESQLAAMGSAIAYLWVGDLNLAEKYYQKAGNDLSYIEQRICYDLGVKSLNEHERDRFNKQWPDYRPIDINVLTEQLKSVDENNITAQRLRGVIAALNGNWDKAASIWSSIGEENLVAAGPDGWKHKYLFTPGLPAETMLVHLYKTYMGKPGLTGRVDESMKDPEKGKTLFEVLYADLPDSPAKINFVLEEGADQLKASYLTRVAQEHPDILLAWIKEKKDVPEFPAPGIALPDLLESAARAATGDTRNSIENILRNTYGRTL